jgi:hypothetical protein
MPGLYYSAELARTVNAQFAQPLRKHAARASDAGGGAIALLLSHESTHAPPRMERT